MGGSQWGWSVLFGVERCEMQPAGRQAGRVSYAKDFGLDPRNGGKLWKVFRWAVAPLCLTL